MVAPDFEANTATCHLFGVQVTIDVATLATFN